MKRTIKLLFNLFMALIAVSLTLLVVLYITPAWQKSAVEQVLARDTGRSWQIGSVQLRPMSIELEKVFVLDGSLGAEIKFIQLEGPIWQTPFTNRIEIESGSIVGLDLDVSQVRVSDPTSVDYQTFLGRISRDEAFWKERIGLVLSKIAASGTRIVIRDLQISGLVRMPGNEQVPIRWTVIEADSASPRLIRIKPLVAPQVIL